MNIYSNFQDILTFLNTEQKERCDMLVEVHTSHSWWERCCKEKNHKGYCDSALTKKEMINAGTYKIDLNHEISARQKKILELQQEMLAVMVEIEMIEKATKK